ncbi:hypothetical protein GCM10010176_100580 [Nonomuraea spiralis]|nr:hypothetical protein GCM10010176_100580 [Nonomuraea spiralis]
MDGSWCNRTADRPDFMFPHEALSDEVMEGYWNIDLAPEACEWDSPKAPAPWRPRKYVERLPSLSACSWASG